MPRTLVFLFLFAFSLQVQRSQESNVLYAAKISSIDGLEAQKIAQQHGFQVIRKLRSFDDIYLLRQLVRRKRDLAQIVDGILKNQNFEWSEPLLPQQRFKRESFPVKIGKNPVHVGIAVNSSGVTTVVVDDGVDHWHTDLQDAFSPEISFDFTNFQADPMPQRIEGNEHGTQCSGLIAMAGESCGMGVSRGARLGGIKVLDGSSLNDAVEGDALAFQQDMIDIYSVSWGPKDDGKTVAKPGRLASQALADGVRKGRNGLGNIFLWASGNGGHFGDNCALDGYASNENTITVGVVNSDGNPAIYAEGCSAVLASVSGGDSLIRTTGFDSKCSVLSGSSAAAAIASGIVGLAIQANPNLSQRDIQHLIIRTASKSSLNVNWNKNAAGFQYNPSVGFGLLDAEALAWRARTWKTVDEEIVCSAEPISPGSNILFPIGNSCDVSFIERVAVRLNIDARRRGDVQIFLTSPKGMGGKETSG
ncbi:unnamed protein product [Caenorhabditis auriculariae]|uniref:P/Homo B domain-containing protein n=1 Tax=Caenorhabditis auriculariae TaxID=2777116 RepID=A0A8S1GMV9_9PELO|nr:unnamed protein product [Caenorhabditis auriculariae]